ncbi:MAG: phosphodiester glycosidase family protein [Actinomycetota bacterium]
MTNRRATYRPPHVEDAPQVPRMTYYKRRFLLSLTVITVVVLAYYGATLAFALGNQSYGVTSSARAAEWGRQHGLGGVGTWAEQGGYTINPAKTGGKPPTNSFGSGPTALNIPVGKHLTPPATVLSPASPTLPGEGVWHPLGRVSADGVPTMYQAFVRPDAVHTSFVAGIVWMDPTLLRAQLYSGSTIPGNGPFLHSAPIKTSATTSLVAAFNAGFRMQDANGGYYTDGRVVQTLRSGAASVVIFKDGTLTMGQWGRDITMSQHVASVRQNLDLIVDHGAAVPGLLANDHSKWGATLGGSVNVWRSALGVTASGAVVYVAGDSLSITDLADLLVRAGAIRGMEMDINRDWVQFSSFDKPLGKVVSGADGTRLLSSMVGPPSRYFATWWNRDFFTMSLRPSTLKKK